MFNTNVNTFKQITRDEFFAIQRLAGVNKPMMVNARFATPNKNIKKETPLVTALINNRRQGTDLVVEIANGIGLSSMMRYIFVIPFSFHRSKPDNGIRLFFNEDGTPREEGKTGEIWKFCKGILA